MWSNCNEVLCLSFCPDEIGRNRYDGICWISRIRHLSFFSFRFPVSERCGGRGGWRGFPDYWHVFWLMAVRSGTGVHACLGVTGHLNFRQNDRGLLRATAVTRGVERTPNKRQHTKLTQEEKILPPLLPGFELTTFWWRVRRSYQQAILEWE